MIAEVLTETLRQRSPMGGKWRRVFDRTAGGAVRGSTTFPLSGFAQIVDKIPKAASLVTVLVNYKHREAQRVAAIANRVAGNVLTDRREPDEKMLIDHLVKWPEHLEKLKRELARVDVGIDDMVLQQTPIGAQIVFRHRALARPMLWALESHGTRAFMRTYPWLILALDRGGIAVVDELDLAMHPTLLAEAIGWFYDPGRNPRDAQLWMSCHSVSLMEDLTKEEVVLCEKDSDGRTKVYSLMDVDVRRSDNLYRKYMGGAYGAVPAIG